MKHQLGHSWKEWIRHNINQGCDKEGIVKILLDNDFHPQTILSEMKYQPVSLEVLGIIKQKMSTQLFTPVISNQNAQQAGLLSLSGSGIDNSHSDTSRNLDVVHLPFSKKVETDLAHMYLVDDFLSHDECDEVIAKIQQQCRPSTITTADEPDKEFRTSQTCDLSHHPDDFIKDLDRRIADYIGYEEERAEGIQGQYYQVGNQFKSHTDYFQPNTKEFEKFAGKLGQRTWTFMIYLNDVPEGGQTEFTKLGVAFSPKKGQAVIWNNLHSDGQVNRNTLHWAKPIIKGEKFVITKWFRTRGYLDRPFTPYLHQQIQAFTTTGFKKSTLPVDLYKKITNFYQSNRVNAPAEDDGAIGTFIHTKERTAPTKMVELSDVLRSEIFQTIHPMLEEWSGQQLEHTAVYGIREYQQGATLDMHIDRYQTHIISAIINVDQDVNSDWPLYVYDHYSRLHKVILKPGEIIFYESAKIAHGRPEALDGKRYANIFAHTMPSDWKTKSEQMTQQLQSGELQQRMKFTSG